ncbi:MAG: TOBE domain-containing protein [Anaerolineae bacterium]|nr:TOBE domain-containing protein [Anaerolineae bacterium]
MTKKRRLVYPDKVAVIFEGKLHQIGTPSELYTRPVNQSVASFIGEANILPATAYGSQAESALGTHRLLSPKEGAVEILIRPDMLHLQPTDEGKPAVILWREYYGHHQRIGLQLEDGTQLIARVDTQIMYNVGQNIRVSVYAPLLAFD